MSTPNKTTSKPFTYRPKSKLLNLSVTALATAVASFNATPAFTQDGASLEEVIVTAQRREQSLQDVSISLSAFSGNDLNDRLIEEMQDLQFNVPNLLADGLRIAIRGVGNNAISSTAENGLGFHINGVYVNRPLTRNSEYFDLERIEVLRGPQGTLYGRNTTAGVINIITAKPTDEFEGSVTASVGNFGALRAKGMLNFPVTDKINQRFAAFYHERDGYTKNLYTGDDVDGRDIYEIRSSTSFEFSDRTSANLVINYQQEDSNRDVETKGLCTKDPTIGCSPLSTGFETPDVSGSIFQVLNLAFLGGALMPAGDYFADSVNPANLRQVNAEQTPTYETEQLGVSFELNHEFDNYQFTSLTGYYDTQSDVFQDFDRFATDVRLNFPVTFRANARDVITTDRILAGRRDIGDSQQFTQEFRLASQYDGGFNFLLGAFYYQEEAAIQALITHPTLAFAQQAFGLDEDFERFNVESDPIETESIAIFGEAYFDLSDKLRLTAGLRFTSDEKDIRTRQQFFILVDPEWVEASDSWEEVTGKATLEYSLSDDSMVFVTAGRGYKAGGLNPGGPTGGAIFDPEYINQLEFGTKSTFLDGKLQANLGAFFYDYEDLQIGQVSETSAVTTNGDSTVMGAEGEFRFLVSSNFEVDFNISWLDIELNDFASADQGDPAGIAPGSIQAVDENGNPRFTGSGLVIKDLDGNALRNAPEFSAKIGFQYNLSMDSGYQLAARLDHFWQDTYFANEFNKPTDVIDSWDQTDAQLILTPPSQSWYLKAFARNILDNDDVIRIGQAGPLVGLFRGVTVLEPRTYGLELQVNF